MKKQTLLLLASLKERTTPVFIVILVIVAFRIWLITGIPKQLVYGPHDDLFFAKAAHFIIHRQWMGPYSQMTLIKGPFYAFFMIFSFFSGLPLLVTETAFYIIACIVLFFAISPLIKNHWWRLLAFVLLLFCPASLVTYWTVRVYREFVYFSLTLFVVAFSIGLLLRIDRKLPSLIFWATGLGLSMGAFMLCREEGVWIYPAVLLLMLSSVIIIWFKKMDQRWLRSAVVFSPIVIWYIPIFVVSYLNYSYYGFWGYSENLDKNFNRVINTIGRIKTSTSALYPYNAITRESFAKAYAVSPLLEELRAPVEANWDGWQYWSDYSMSGMPEWYRQEYLVKGAKSLNSHIMFLLRDALATAGYYSNGQHPYTYLKELADQLEATCNREALKCSPGTDIPYAGSMKAEQIPIILRFFSENIYKLLKLDVAQSKIDPLDIANWPPYQPEFNYFEEFVYNPIESKYFGQPQNDNQLVGGKINISLRILHHKEVIMSKIQSIYTIITLPGFILFGSSWLVLLLFKFLKMRQKDFSLPALLVFLFLLGLLISRIMMLALISANSNVYMIGYSNSSYVFIYLIFFIVLFYLVDQITQLILLSRRKTLDLSLESL